MLASMKGVKSEELNLENTALLIYFSHKTSTLGLHDNTYKHNRIDNDFSDHTEERETRISKIGDGGGGIVLLDGAAFIYCTSINKNIRYSFNSQFVYLEVNTNARVRIDGAYKYVYANYDANLREIHSLLELYRDNVSSSQVSLTSSEQSTPSSRNNTTEELLPDAGPRVMIIGNNELCKLHLCYSLINLATQASLSNSTTVAYVNVNVNPRHALRCPGSLSTVFVNDALEVDDPLTRYAALSFFFGFYEVTDITRKRYLDLCAYMAESVDSVMRTKKELRRGGVILHTMPAHSEFEFDLLREFIHLFKITHIIISEPNIILEVVINKVIINRPVYLFRYNMTSLHRLEATLLQNTEEHFQHESEYELPFHLTNEKKEWELWYELERNDHHDDNNNSNDNNKLLSETMHCTSPQVASSTIVSLPIEQLYNNTRFNEFDSHLHDIGMMIYHYFYGSTRTRLTPFHGVANLDQVILIDAGTLQPIGTKTIPANALAAVVWADTLSRVAEANVAGFIIITDKGKRRFSFLSPATGSLPTAYILVSSSITVPQWCIPPVRAAEQFYNGNLSIQ